MSEKTTFETLYELDVRDKLEKKKSGGSELDYLSWGQGWREVKKLYPDANYEFLRFGENNLPYVYDPETGYMVFVRTTIDSTTYEMCLPVMDGSNKAMKAESYTYTVGSGDKQREKSVEAATMFDINKALMRCFVKCLAMHGLGLSLYFKETVAPETAERIRKEKDEEEKQAQITIKNLQAEIVAKAKKLVDGGLDSGMIYDEITKISGKKNPNSIKDIEICNQVVQKLNEMRTKNKSE
jgi:hypothetical protein